MSSIIDRTHSAVFKEPETPGGLEADSKRTWELKPRSPPKTMVCEMSRERDVELNQPSCSGSTRKQLMQPPP